MVSGVGTYERITIYSKSGCVAARIVRTPDGELHPCTSLYKRSGEKLRPIKG